MSSPNIVGVTSIYGNSGGVELTTTSPTGIISCPLSSNKIYKVNFIRCANTSGVSTADITVQLYKADTAATHNLALTIGVPADSALVILDKDSSLYLREGDQIKAQASSSNILNITSSWEEIN
jgi:hypothetical protein